MVLLHELEDVLEVEGLLQRLEQRELRDDEQVHEVPHVEEAQGEDVLRVDLPCPDKPSCGLLRTPVHPCGPLRTPTDPCVAVLCSPVDPCAASGRRRICAVHVRRDGVYHCINETPNSTPTKPPALRRGVSKDMTNHTPGPPWTESV